MADAYTRAIREIQLPGAEALSGIQGFGGEMDPQIKAAALEAYREAMARPGADQTTAQNALLRALGIAAGGYASKAVDAAAAPGSYMLRKLRGLATGTPMTAPLFGGGAPSAMAASAGAPPGPRPPPPPAFDRAKDLAEFDAQMRRAGGATQSSVGMPSGNFAAADLALKNALAATTGLKLDPVTQFNSVKDWEQRRAAAGTRPDVESDDYAPLAGKRLSDFMLNFGLNMLGSSGDGRTFAGSLGASAKDAKLTAEAKVGKKLAADTEDWKQKLADASTLTSLGQNDYTSQANAAKTAFEAARAVAEGQGKLGAQMGAVAGEKSADSYRRALVAAQSDKNAVQKEVEVMKQITAELAKAAATRPENKGRKVKDIYDEMLPGVVSSKFSPKPDVNAKFNNDKYVAAYDALSKQFPDIATKNPAGLTEAATLVAQGQAELGDIVQRLTKGK